MRDRYRYLLVAILGVSGALHLVAPRPYRAIVPAPLPFKGEIVLVSGVVELLCAGMLVVPRWRRAGGWVSAALLVAVFPANVAAALDGGYHGLRPPFDSALAAWLRLPLQIPLVLIALAVARRQSSEGNS